MTNYRKGVQKEYQFKKYLKDVYMAAGSIYGEDFVIVRSAGSHSAFDIVLFDFKNCEVHCYQIKYSPCFNQRMNKELKELKEISKIICVWKHFVWYKKGKNTPIFVWSEK